MTARRLRARATGIALGAVLLTLPALPAQSIATATAAPSGSAERSSALRTAVNAELREFASRTTSDADPSEPPARRLPPPRLQCTPATVEAFVRRYTIVFNRGKIPTVRRFFAARRVPIVRGADGGPQVVDPDRRGFRWYTVAATGRGLTRSARAYFIGRHRNRVAKYVMQRRRRGERLAFVTTTGFQALQVGGVPHAGIAFLMKRRANDLLPRRRWRMVTGKALIDCQSGKISVFSV